MKMISFKLASYIYFGNIFAVVSMPTRCQPYGGSFFWFPSMWSFYKHIHDLIGTSFMEFHLQEQFFIMKPDEFVTRSFKLYPNTDQAAKYECTGE